MAPPGKCAVERGRIHSRMADPDHPVRPRRSWTRGEAIVVVAAVLLVADLLLLPWYHYAIDTSALDKLGIHVPGFTRNVNGLHNPQAFFGVAALAVSLAMILQVLAAKFTAVVPRQEQIHLVAGPVVLGLVLAKLVANHDFLGLGAWAGLVLAAAVAYGGFLLSQEAPAGS
jgi:hypothetical protein